MWHSFSEYLYEIFVVTCVFFGILCMTLGIMFAIHVLFNEYFDEPNDEAITHRNNERR